MKINIAVIALLFTVSALADEHASLVEEAFANISEDFHEVWSFTETQIEDGVTTVGRYDPSLAENARWQLLTVDGRLPTTNEIDDYRDDKDDEFDGNDGDGAIDIVTLDTVKLIEETADYWLFRFVPNADDDEEDEAARKFMEKVHATVRINRNGRFPEYLDMRNDKPIQPAFGVKISRFLTRMTFGPAGEHGPIVPLSIDVAIKGRALLAIGINEKNSVQYDEWEYVGS